MAKETSSQKKARQLKEAKARAAKNAAKKGGVKTTSKSSSSKKESSSYIDRLKKSGSYEAFKRLSPDQQAFAEYNDKILRSNNKDKTKKLQEALKEATAQADPYWKSYLTVAQDEVKRSYDDVMNTSEFQKNELEVKIKNIADDLAKNRDFYTLEQQSDLAKLKQSYEQQRTGVIEDAAAKGLTFSTQREVPLKQLEDYNKNVVESTNRGYEKKIGDITTNAQQTTDEALRQKQKLAQDTAAKLTDIGREAEKQYGTDNLPTLPGYTPLGDISGNLYEDKVKDIALRQNAIFDEKINSSLNF